MLGTQKNTWQRRRCIEPLQLNIEQARRYRLTRNLKHEVGWSLLDPPLLSPGDGYDLSHPLCYVCILATLQNILVMRVYYSEDFNLDVGLFKSYHKPYKNTLLNKHKHTLDDFTNLFTTFNTFTKKILKIL